MNVSRRRVLSLIGGGVVLAAAGGGYVATRTATRAVEPWKLAGEYGEIRRNALSWALLAPNPHNLQPWQAELIGDDRVALSMDATRTLPHTDPFGRQITIGMGCFIELMRMAAAQAGYGVDLTVYPDGEDGGRVAIARFVPGAAAPDPLYAAVAERRSCKEPFEDRPVPADAIAALREHGIVVTGADAVQALRNLTWEAWVIEMETPRTWKESIDLLRIGARQVDASPDGIDLTGAFFNLGGTLGFITQENQLPLDSMGARMTADIYREVMARTPAYVLQVSDGNTRRDQLEAGARWLRLNLATTALGLSLHPVSQALQEYPEMAGPYQRIHDLYATPGQTVQMLGRLGYGPKIPQTPRWRLEDKLVS
ncbi:Acg family FMN-binding oxidoreductase [Zhengella sp. ZM62]|uniref:Acg family FMN-binding oxidoreductase n=1 Tax=Zhengella sedimenti TaxID=3390035 RepID=UPI003976EBBB